MPTSPPITKYRQYINSNIESFKRKIGETDFTGVLQCNDAQKAFTMYHKQYLNVYEACFPIKTVKSNYRTRKPCLTTAIKNSIWHKNVLYKKSHKRPSLQNTSCYKEYKSLLNMLIKRCEKAYEEQFKLNTNNLKRSRALIKNIINKHGNKNVSTRFKFGGEVASDKKRIAEEFTNSMSMLAYHLLINHQIVTYVLHRLFVRAIYIRWVSLLSLQKSCSKYSVI